jgi:hypothetical protein
MGVAGLDQVMAAGQAGQVGAAAAAGLVPDPVQVERTVRMLMWSCAAICAWVRLLCGQPD